MTDWLQSHRHHLGWRRLLVGPWLDGVSRRARGETPHPLATRVDAMLVDATSMRDGSTDWELTYARALEHVLQRCELTLHPHELLVGNLSSQRIGAPLHPEYAGLLVVGELADLPSRDRNPIAVDDAQVELLRDQIVPYWMHRSIQAIAPRGSQNSELLDQLTAGTDFVLTQFAGISHVTPDYGHLVRCGVAGLLADIDAGGGNQAQRTVLAALRTYGRRWRAHVQAAIPSETDPARRAELRSMAEVLTQVPEHPARTFREGLQTLVLAHAALHRESFQHGISFGRLDQYLWPLLRADLEAGRTDHEEAVELIGCLLAKASELVPLFFDRATDYFSGLSSASGITLGGTDPEGADASNLLTTLILDAYDQLRLRQPNLHLRLHEGSPEALRHRCWQSVQRGGGMPAMFNDAEIVPALVSAGFPERDARDYSVVGCAEWGVPGQSFPAAGAIFLNLASALRQAVQEASSADTAETVFVDFVARLETIVATAVEGNNAIERAHAERRPTPLLSCLVDGCTQSGLDVTRGGARFNTTGIQLVGLSDCADSFAALQSSADVSALLLATQRDFPDPGIAAGVSSRPGLGSGDPVSLRWAVAIQAAAERVVARHRNPRGGRYLVGLWTMTTHQGFGSRTGALPSGRRAGAPLANGMGCASHGRGPTATLGDISGLRTPHNGGVLNVALSPAVAGGTAGQSIIDALVRGFFAQGGAQLQLDVLDSATLRAARRDPTCHRDLVVRISGYSAYFCDLTPAMQDEIIARAEAA